MGAVACVDVAFNFRLVLPLVGTPVTGSLFLSGNLGQGGVVSGPEEKAGPTLKHALPRGARDGPRCGDGHIDGLDAYIVKTSRMYICSSIEQLYTVDLQ